MKGFNQLKEAKKSELRFLISSIKARIAREHKESGFELPEYIDRLEADEEYRNLIIQFRRLTTGDKK